MRPGEVLNLRRGCRGIDTETGELLVHGFRGKGYDRAPDAPGATEPERPWVVVDVVHQAIQLLEDLHDLPLLFPASLVVARQDRPAEVHARDGKSMNDDIDGFITWINTHFRPVDSTPAIPADPHGRIIASRFRRTLARFIVRRPRGLIAAALQYGHIHTKVTLNYAGRGDQVCAVTQDVDEGDTGVEHGQMWNDPAEGARARSWCSSWRGDAHSGAADSLTAVRAADSSTMVLPAA
ncbi:hypothetical protein [Nonomuraea sp. KM90]|uniref:hypothetical protein n=1 Tax=Nonomuraea sp. KM90 TaxID=3457428 RepID=UPI003FCE289B